MLVVLNALTLLVKGAPWGTTTALALVGSKLVSALGLAVASWPYWAGARGAVLRAPLLADATLVMDAGLVLGALLAAAVAGRFALRQRLPWSSVLAAVLGGVLMGYGAQLADGCTVAIIRIPAILCARGDTRWYSSSRYAGLQQVPTCV